MEKRVEDLRVLQEQKEFKRRETKAAADAEEQRKIDTVSNDVLQDIWNWCNQNFLPSDQR